jgi:hypothetical protein
MKPRYQRGIRFVEDGISSGRNRVTTELTAIGFAIGYLIMSGYLLTFLTEYALRITGVFKKLQTSVIIWELLLKVFYAVRAIEMVKVRYNVGGE